MDGQEALQNLDRVAVALGEYRSDYGEDICAEAREHHWGEMRMQLEEAVRCHSALVAALAHANGESGNLTLDELLTWLCEPQDDGETPNGTSRLIQIVQSAAEDKSAGYAQSTLADRFSYGWLVEMAGDMELDGEDEEDGEPLRKISIEQLERAAIEFREFLTDGDEISAIGYAKNSIEIALEEVPDSEGTVWIDTVTGKVISGE